MNTPADPLLRVSTVILLELLVIWTLKFSLNVFPLITMSWLDLLDPGPVLLPVRSGDHRIWRPGPGSPQCRGALLAHVTTTTMSQETHYQYIKNMIMC